ncbi:hypothetical protein C5H23_03030 [Xylella fastidiosa]|uniref:hypothetical protein n=1 Tax=Xylella fastidiosa TaxID=2371 RepID=UPI0004DCC926|nr:hypothetical protein [Xylella fastidiosa]RWA37268.1 hypothetical protein XfCFBP8078_08745 [Xylella fastidiosa subsp. multiplex]KFA40425.1 hypothetical protein DF22_003065 [Xylella fastidiosa]TNV90557.1 hypothetical protein C5H23_03030 [Xylella fastidiosa]TNV91905.1 hypothetical protein C5H22_13585 [Xylella fastidiosa]TNV97310.1 hypothetical protein C5H21_13865 [Xylella fastidiosa]
MLHEALAVEISDINTPAMLDYKVTDCSHSTFTTDVVKYQVISLYVLLSELADYLSVSIMATLLLLLAGGNYMAVSSQSGIVDPLDRELLFDLPSNICKMAITHVLPLESVPGAMWFHHGDSPAQHIYRLNPWP